MPLFESLFLCALVVLLVRWRARSPAQGDLFRGFVAAYFAWRLVVDFWKHADCRWLGLSAIQWVTVLGSRFSPPTCGAGSPAGDMRKWRATHDRVWSAEGERAELEAGPPLACCPRFRLSTSVWALIWVTCAFDKGEWAPRGAEVLIVLAWGLAPLSWRFSGRRTLADHRPAVLPPASQALADIAPADSPLLPDMLRALRH